MGLRFLGFSVLGSGLAQCLGVVAMHLGLCVLELGC